MVKSLENGVSLAPFLVKCYDMVDDESTNELISWTESNDSFIIRDESKFSSELLPKYFKHKNVSSFVRQLNIYGFRKIDTDHLEFANESFIRGQKHLLKNITRRKYPQSLVERKPSQKKDMNPVTPSEADRNIALWKEVETLKADKIALTQELANLSLHQQNSQSKLLLLREQIKGMETNQQQMLSFIVMAMQRPEFLLQFLQPKENTWHVPEAGNNELSEVSKSIPSNGTIVRYLPPPNVEDSVPVAMCKMEDSNSEDLMEMDLSCDQIRDVLIEIDLLLGSPMTVDDDKMNSLRDYYDQWQEVLLSSTTENEGEETETFTDSHVQIGSEIQPKESEKFNGLNENQTR